MSSEISRAFRGTAFWGLRRAPADVAVSDGIKLALRALS